MRTSPVLLASACSATLAVLVPSIAAAEETAALPTKEKQSPALMATGVLLDGVGGAGIVSGLVMILASQPDPLGLNSLECPWFDAQHAQCLAGGTEDVSLKNTGIAFAVSGAVLAAIGTPLIIYGAHRVPVARPVPTVSVGAGSVRMKWEF